MHTDSTKTEGNSRLKERNVYSSSVVRMAELTITEGNVDCDRWSLVCDRSLRDSVAWCCSGTACLLKQPISFIDEGRSNFCDLRVQRFFFFFIFLNFFFFFLILLVFLRSTNLGRGGRTLVILIPVVVPIVELRAVRRHSAQTQTQIPQRHFHFSLGHAALASGLR